MEEMRSSDDCAGAITLNAAIHSGASDVERATPLDNCLVQWAALPLIVFPKVNAQHLGLALKFHFWASCVSGSG
jgi:hypothetical protein